MTEGRLKQLQTLLAETPGDPFLAFAIAKEYYKSGNKEQALAEYEKLAAEHPQYAGTYYHLGKLYEELNWPDKAIHIYKQGLSATNRPDTRHEYNELKGALVNLDDEDDED
jgi:tetratricopeptide (TPR) repeat protein